MCVAFSSTQVWQVKSSRAVTWALFLLFSMFLHLLDPSRSVHPPGPAGLRSATESPCTRSCREGRSGYY